MNASSYLKEDSQRGEDNGEDELEDIGAGKSHCKSVLELCVWS